MTLPSLLRALLVATHVFSLGGCSALTALGSASTPLDVYELRAPGPSGARPGRVIPVDVTIELPTSGGALQTDRIMIKPGPLQAEYLPQARWGDETPVMLQTLLLRSIEATQAVRYIGRRPLGARADYAIITELTDFQAELTESRDTAEVRISFISRMVREDDARIVATRTFSSNFTAQSLETKAIIEAFDRASTGLLSEFSSWVLATLRRR
ncbi:ABC-type transport auxiliary lipoprotein family protein [Roseovarius aestuariivivens]|uniref:ABC-type transport auxiliary lipoprotein family protein n=1 Tax=Roseovarius aestuariivivens TaxID=1888910 RepID=UPI0010812B9F|nr:ABC-type transport auxiliary lipoprotein family protein [Roseovarius aestuariivivens]